MKGEKKKQISSLTAHLKNLTETFTCIVNYILHNIIRRHKIKMLIIYLHDCTFIATIHTTFKRSYEHTDLQKKVPQ